MLNSDYQDILNKIMELCDENKLEFEFEYSKFPIVANIKPVLEQQGQLFIADANTNFVNGKISFIFGDEPQITILNDFNINDNLLNKIKNLVKKLHYVFLQGYFKIKNIQEVC